MTAVPATLRTKSGAGRGTGVVRRGGPCWPEGPAGAAVAPASPFLLAGAGLASPLPLPSGNGI